MPFANHDTAVLSGPLDGLSLQNIRQRLRELLPRRACCPTHVCVSLQEILCQVHEREVVVCIDVVVTQHVLCHQLHDDLVCKVQGYVTIASCACVDNEGHTVARPGIAQAPQLDAPLDGFLWEVLLPRIMASSTEIL